MGAKLPAQPCWVNTVREPVKYWMEPRIQMNQVESHGNTVRTSLLVKRKRKKTP
jgi:hypothetical protein